MSDESKIVDMNGRPVVEESACCGSCSGGGDCEKQPDPAAIDEDEQQKLVERQYIKHPFMDDFMPIAIIESTMKTYIGGVAEFYEKSCIIVQPMLFRELISQEGALQIGMQVPYMALGCIDELQLKYDSFYLLQNSRPQDMKLAAFYEENFTQTRIADSGLITPSQDDMIKLSRG